MVDRKNLLREGRDLLMFALVAVFQSYFTCRNCANLKSYLLIFCITFLMWVVLWKGNEWVNHFVSRYVSWIKFPVKRFFIGVVSTIVFTIVAINVLIFSFESVTDLWFGKAHTYTVYTAVGITIMVSLFLHGREFLFHWRDAAFEKEKYEKESIAAKYESLKNQVNPHFLFNSLNVLTQLVYEDQDKAVKFIKQLSDIYRYVLETREKEVVPIADEKHFLDSYTYLQKIRFGDKLKIDISLETKGAYITPLALQMLVENAIKHNVIAEDAPLSIKVFDEGEFVCVQNNLQRKQTLHEPSAGIGLENIIKRYELLSERKVAVINNGEIFEVRLPRLFLTRRPD